MSNTVLVENTTHHYTQQISVGKHTLLSDEPIALKGDDMGPAPYDLLLSALGSCTAITLTMYAELKKINLEIITVKLDYTPPNKKEETAARISRKIHLEGDFTDAQHQRMLEIADRCPVHKTLSQGISIESSLE